MFCSLKSIPKLDLESSGSSQAAGRENTTESTVKSWPGLARPPPGLSEYVERRLGRPPPVPLVPPESPAARKKKLWGHERPLSGS